MVIHTSGLAGHPTSLGSVYTPPGGGTCQNNATICGCERLLSHLCDLSTHFVSHTRAYRYAEQCVTRDYMSAYGLFKFPLTPSLLSTSNGTVNNAQYTFSTTPTATVTSKGVGDTANLLYQNGLTSMPASGPVAVSISGQNMFPMMNNNGGLTFPSCETDMCNAHAGQGFDYHYHGDPFGPQCLYSCANYTTLTSHPPLIGYGLDGIPIFGRHLASNAVGANWTLDDCGGHTHSGINDPYLTDGQYHYHSFVQNITSLNVASYAYTAYLHGPFMCWKGNISAIPNFFEAGANPVGRSDYASGQIKPCTGNINIYLAPGFTLNGVTGSGFNYSSKTYTVGAGSSGGACSAATALSPPPSPPPPPRPPPPKPPSPPPPTTSFSISTSALITTNATTTSGSTCTVGATVACTSNSSSSVTRSLVYSSSTGIFTGTMTTNSCPSTITTFTQAMGTCTKIYFPATGYTSVTTSGKTAPIVGAVGYTLSGMNIYNPLENGFSSTSGPTICSTSGYFCSAGTDIDTCIAELYYTCGTAQASAVAAQVAGTTFGDKCAGHANPYHFHHDAKCEYSPSSSASASTVTAHSPLVGVALDGRGIYGAWESAGTRPTLDACGGHVGTTPTTASATSGGVIGSALSGITGIVSKSVYHYHFSNTYPYTLGCFSKAYLSYTACTALYPGCKTFRPNVYANGSKYFYDDWCPCGTTIAATGGLPISSVNAIPTVSGATCFSTFAGSSAPASSANSGAVACTTALLSSASITTGRRLLSAVDTAVEITASRQLLEVSAPVAAPAPAPGPAPACDGWCAPPGFLDNFPFTVSRFLGFKAQQQSNISIDKVFSVQIPGVVPASYSSVEVWYYLPSDGSVQSLALMKTLNSLPQNASFIAALATIFPGVTAVSIGTTTARVGSVADPNAILSTPVPSASSAAAVVRGASWLLLAALFM